MVTIDDIYELIRTEYGTSLEDLRPASDLFADMGIDGDDFFELMDAFEKRFGVDLSSYRWYFHHGPEVSWSPGRLFFKPPYSSHHRIPITPEIMLNSANARSWLITYPDHEWSGKRNDIFFDKVFFGVIVTGFLAFCIWQLFTGSGNGGAICG